MTLFSPLPLPSPSAVTGRFRSPVSTSDPVVTASRDAAVFPLALASEGDLVRIQRLQGGHGLMKRLTDLGLNQGAELQVVQRQGRGLVVARGDSRIALGGGMATKILVTAVAR